MEAERFAEMIKFGGAELRIMTNKDIKEIQFESAEYSVIDFETTGVSPLRDRVIEVGIVKVKNGKITDTFSSFVNPQMPIPYYITSLTGITENDVHDAPFFEDIVRQIIEFIGDSVLTAHNMSFDFGFLKNELQRAEYEVPGNPTLCTLKLARKLFPDLPSKSLGKVVKHLKLRHRDVHRGLGDAMATAKVLTKMFGILKEEHGLETVSDLISFQGTPAAKTGFRIIKKKMAEDLGSLPDEPGVYFFRDAKDKIIYIGKAKSLRTRVRNYFLSNAPRKTKEIVRKASRIGYQITNSELTALLAEAELIKIHNPHYNKLLKNYSRNYFIRIKTDHPFPVAEVSSAFDFDGNEYYGPYPNRETASNLVAIIDKTFRLRECTEKELKKKRPCYLRDIQRCLAPCVEKGIEDAYREEILHMVEFLSGQNQSAVNRLLGKMKEFAENQKYEEAAEIRDVVNQILNQLNRSSILQEPINKASVLIEINGYKKADMIMLIEGKIFIRNHFVDKKDYFHTALNDYFEGAVNLFKMLEEKDLEQLKISLSWLVKNRNSIKIHYLSRYNSLSELAANLIYAGSISQPDNF